MEPEITTPAFGTGHVPPQRVGDEPYTEPYHGDYQQYDAYYATPLQEEQPYSADNYTGLGEPRLDDAPGYVVPEVAPAGWSARASRRRAWVCRAVLALIMLVQAVLSVRLHNTAFQDEALYIYAGHMEIAHIFHGAPLNYGYNSYFSGSPVLYPVLAGAMDSLHGLTGARALSLFFMLACTGFLYSLTRRLFNERVGLFAAVLFAASQSTIVLGWFATYDSAALFLLAFAAWVVVRTDRANPFTVLFAAPILVLAFCTKYAAGIFIPTVVVLAVIVAWPHRGARALWRGVLLSAALGAIGGMVVYGSSIMAGIQSTTTSRAHGTDSMSSLINMSADWTGLALAVACWGALSYVRRGRISEVTSAAQKTTAKEPGRIWRTMLCLLLCGTGLLAPAYQIHLSTSVSLYKHVGFGLFFFAPLAGLGVSRIVGPHFRRTEMGLLIAVLALSSGIAQSQWRYTTWPDSTQLINLLRPQVNSKGLYLADIESVPIYYFQKITKASQWENTYYLGYTDAKGVKHTGTDAYTAAINDGRYNLVVLESADSVSPIDRAIAKALPSSGKYRLYSVLPFTNSWGSYQIWIKVS